jgi:hypothetical protein
MFAILGGNLMMNKCGYCYGSNSVYGVTQQACLAQGKRWFTDFSFDNVFYAMISLFDLFTQENWPSFMYQCIDGDTPEIVTLSWH